MRYSLFLFAQLIVVGLFAQSADPLAGQFTARFNEDNLTLSLDRDSDGAYTGTMKDSYQTYAIALQLSGTNVSGTATEATLGLRFEVTGEIQGAQLPLRFTLDFMGEKNTMDISFIKSDSQAQRAQGGQITTADVVLPAGASHPQDVLGTWVKEELYQSGYGDNAMGAGFSQSMTFLPNGRLADGGSSAYMSGSTYSGQSSGSGEGVIPGLSWYTIGNQFYLQAIENGQTQHIHLGRYYVENNNMLITGTNGEKILLSRK